MSRISIQNYANALYLALDELADPKELGDHFNRLLSKNKQKKLLTRILLKLDEIRANRTRELDVVVEVARPLESEMKEKLKATLERRFAKNVILIEKINPEIIGGVRLSFGETKYNGAILDKLELMKEQIHG